MSRQDNPVNEVGIFTASNSWSGIPENDYVHGLLSGGVWGDNDPDVGNVTNLLFWYFSEGYQTTTFGDFFYQPVDIGHGIASGNTDQGHKPGLDLANGLTIHSHTGR